MVTLTKWRGDFYRDETIYGSLGLFAENDEPSTVPAAAPRNQTVQFEPDAPAPGLATELLDDDIDIDIELTANEGDQ